MISSGYMDILGTATAEYWETMRTHFGIDPPPEGAPSFGLLLFGDEAEIYKDNQFMAISWSSEQSPFWSDCMKSRYLICLLPAHRYAMAGKVNLTIQEAMKQICKSVNEWQSTGVAGVHTRFVSLKGDWKWLGQCLNLTRKPGQNQFCFLCDCTRDMQVPMTDLGKEALWRTCTASCPWAVPPEILHLKNFSLATVGLDILHLWHLGTGRDLASSALLILLRMRGVFPGAKVSELQRDMGGQKAHEENTKISTHLGTHTHIYNIYTFLLIYMYVPKY